MNQKDLLDLAKANPQVVANLLEAVTSVAKADTTGKTMIALLGLLAGETTLGTFAKDYPGLVASLFAMLAAHPEIFAALLSAMGH